MITLYSGTPGAGKSLHLATRLYHWMQFKDAPIIGNFATNFSSIKKRKGFYIYMDNSELTPEKLIKFSQYYSQIKGRRVKEGEILLVIDECQILFNSRDWGQKNRAQWCAFFLLPFEGLGVTLIRPCSEWFQTFLVKVNDELVWELGQTCASCSEWSHNNF